MNGGEIEDNLDGEDDDSEDTLDEEDNDSEDCSCSTPESLPLRGVEGDGRDTLLLLLLKTNSLIAAMFASSLTVMSGWA